MSAQRYLRRSLLLLALSAGVAPLDAQSIRGVVVQQDAATPARGIVVLVVGADNKVAGRALTATSGAFDVKLENAGAYSVRALRIGYRPTDLGPFDLARDSVHTVRVVLSGEAIALEVVSVIGRQSCRNTGDGSAVAAAWLQARTALTAASITAESREFVSRYSTWERVANEVDSIVTWQRSNMGESARPKVFISAPPDSLTRVGYAFFANDEFVFLGPDADVLLSDEFASTHCFRLVPTRDRDPSRVAIEFSPAGRRRGMVDVRGQLILDRQTSELQSLEFSYEGLPRGVNERHAGGRMRFTRVPDGAWIVSHWALRIPAMEIEGSADNLAGARATIVQVRESGGEITQVTKGSDVAWQGRRRHIAGRLLDTKGELPAIGGVALDGTDVGQPVDADGMFRFDNVIPGRYRLTGRSGALDSLGIPVHLGTVDVRDSSVTGLSMRLPAPEAVYRKACDREGEGATHATGMLRGVVLDADGKGAPGIMVRVQFVSADTIGTRIVATRGRRLMIETGPDGTFAYCRVPRGSFMRIAATRGGEDNAGPEVDAVLPRGLPFVVVELRAPKQLQ